ncbi:hypothetical protein L7F22_050357 [Adiantum nelumboides]|nr:hypothetical protein [Adiantum nelumboides]
MEDFQNNVELSHKETQQANDRDSNISWHKKCLSSTKDKNHSQVFTANCHTHLLNEHNKNQSRSCDKEERYMDLRGYLPRSIRQWGGKDRHSKVLTSRGVLRDRRVRLSVSTAIRFYDVQDKLGFDQPSKAIEWLLDKSQWAFDTMSYKHNLYQSSTSENAFDFDFCEADENFSKEHVDSSRDESSVSCISTFNSPKSNNSITTQNLCHIDQCNNEVQHNFGTNYCDAMKSQAIHGMGNDCHGIDDLMVDGALQGEGTLTLESQNSRNADAQTGLMVGMEVEVDKGSAKIKRSKSWRDGQTFHESLNKLTTTSINTCDLQSPVVMINEAYLYCSSPPFMQTSYIINLANGELASNLEPASSFA